MQQRDEKATARWPGSSDPTRLLTHQEISRFERQAREQTEDDTNDLAVKLATVENIMAQPGANMSGVVTDGAESTDMSDTTQLINHVFNIQNRTNTGDPLFTKYIPSVIAGLTGWDLGLRTSEPANIAVEISLDLTDMNGNRIVQPGDTTATLSMPSTIITPPGARE